MLVVSWRVCCCLLWHGNSRRDLSYISSTSCPARVPFVISINHACQSISKSYAIEPGIGSDDEGVDGLAETSCAPHVSGRYR